MINDYIKMTGKLEVILTDASGFTKQKFIVPNAVVTAGKNVIASRLAGLAGLKAVMSHMSVGTTSTTPVAANTTLGAEIALSRVALSSTTLLNNVVTYSATFPAGTGTGAIVEAGIFNASSAGDMLCRTVFSVVNKSADDTLTINWNVTIN